MVGLDGCLRIAASILVCLFSAACTAPTRPVWVKAGADDAAIESELRECDGQAQAALVAEQRMVNAARRRNWMLGVPVVPLEPLSMREQAAKYAGEVSDNCMRAKGFTKEK